MNCKRCHHTHEAHTHKVQENSDNTNGSLMRVGRCMVPACKCRQYVDPINEIDEDLL